MQYYLESLRAGNSMDIEGEKLRYISKRFILMGPKLGCATEYVDDIVTQNVGTIKEFRKIFKPFDHQYEVKYFKEDPSIQKEDAKED